MSALVTPRRRTSPLAWLLIQPIRFYQRFITPYTPATCRYYPTCSAYAVGALHTHGAVKGTLLTAWRLLRCNPWSSGGVDKVPGRGSWRRPPVEPRESDTPTAAGIPTVAEPTTAAGRSVTDPSENAQPATARAELAGRTAA